MTSGEDQNGHRQRRSEDKRAEVKSDILPTGTRWLGVVRSDTLFEVLFLDAGLSQADVREYISKPSADRKKLVLMYYEDRWWKDVEFRKIWPTDKTELCSALEKWANDRFIERNAARVDSGPLGAKQSDDRLYTQSAPGGGEHGDKGNGDVLEPREWMTESFRRGLEALGAHAIRWSQGDELVQGNRTTLARVVRHSSAEWRRMVKNCRDSGARDVPSCVRTPRPTRSLAASGQSAATLLPAPPSTIRLIGGGAQSMVIPIEVIEAVEEAVARMDGEAAQGHVKVTGRDLQQWNKVVCCVTVTANQSTGKEMWISNFLSKK